MTEPWQTRLFRHSIKKNDSRADNCFLAACSDYFNGVPSAPSV